MPLVRVDMHTSLAPQQAQPSAAIHKGLVAGLEMPADDLFQIFRLHDPGELVYTKTFPNADRTDTVFIRAVGIKQDNVLIAVTENEGSDWFAPEKEA